MQKNDKTLVVITGGTIEALYDPDQGTPYYVPVPASATDSCIPEALQKLGFSNFDAIPLSMKDSKEVTVKSLDFILHHATEQGYDKVVVVHGTDTMPLHARYIERRIAEWGDFRDADQLRVVFTGAMKPLRNTDGSWHPEEKVDGWKNLKMAMEDVQNQPPGVYVEMGEGPWKAREIAKVVDAGDGKPGSMVLKSSFVHVSPDAFDEISFD
jgi:L-asparaginase/Glu-tRNA(Gln) amidotransferase subunit D